MAYFSERHFPHICMMTLKISIEKAITREMSSTAVDAISFGLCEVSSQSGRNFVVVVVDQQKSRKIRKSLQNRKKHKHECLVLSLNVNVFHLYEDSDSDY